MKIPSLSQIMQVSRSRGRNSYAPYIWEQLAGAWPMQVYQKNKVPDVSGRGNKGTMTNMAPATDRVMTPYGGGLDFDGANDYIIIGASNRFALGDAFTLSAIIRSAGVTADTQRIIVRRSAHPDWAEVNYILGLTTDGFAAITVVEPDDDIITAADNVDLRGDNQWHLVSATWDGSHLRLYVDGIRRAIAASTGPEVTGDQRLWIAGDHYDFTVDADPSSFYGSIVNGAIHSRALLPYEIAEHYRDPNAMWTPRPLQMAFPAAAAYTLTAGVGSFALSGQATALTTTRTLAMSVGMFTLTGQAAALVAARTTAMAVGAFTLTGRTIALYVGDQTSDSTNTTIVTTTADATAPGAADPSVLQGTVAELL